MKQLLLAAMISIVYSSSAHAAACEKIEYAELKDTPKAGLVKRYCLYEKFYNIRRETSQKMYGIGATKDGKAYSEEATGCLDEMGKIARILQNQHQLEGQPDCKAPPSAQ